MMCKKKRENQFVKKTPNRDKPILDTLTDGTTYKSPLPSTHKFLNGPMLGLVDFGRMRRTLRKSAGMKIALLILLTGRKLIEFHYISSLYSRLGSPFSSPIHSISIFSISLIWSSATNIISFPSYGSYFRYSDTIKFCLKDFFEVLIMYPFHLYGKLN